MSRSAALQKKIAEQADWVVALRILTRQDPGREPNEAEVRLAVWFLLDQGCYESEIMERTGLTRSDVTRVDDLRRLSLKPDQPRNKGGRVPVDARALRPKWRHVMLLGGAYAARRHREEKAKVAAGRSKVYLAG